MSLTVTPVGREPLQSKRLVLEMASPADAEFLRQVYQLDEFMNCYRLAQDRNVTIEQIIGRLEKELQYSPQQLQRIEWVIKLRSTAADKAGKPLGIASLANYQPAHNRAEFLIGIPYAEDRYAGLGLEASLLVLEFAFQQAKIHKLISIVYSFNRKAQENTLHLGFKQEALLREHYYNYREGLYIDLYQNSLLEKDFFANKNLGRWSKRLLGRDITLEKSPVSRVEIMSGKQLDQALKNITQYAILETDE